MTMTVMGRQAVLVTCSVLGVVGLLTLAGVRTSGSVEEFGPMVLDRLWAGALLTGGITVWLALRFRSALSQTMVEVSGMACTAAGVVVLGSAIVMSIGVEGAVAVLGLCTAVAVNLVGRCVYLIRQAIS